MKHKVYKMPLYSRRLQTQACYLQHTVFIFLFCIVVGGVVWASSSVVRAESLAFSNDKAAHFGVSVLLTVGTYSLLQHMTANEWLSLSISTGTTLLLGIAKESLDGLGLGTPSWSDMFWNVLGACTGLLISWVLLWCSKKLLGARRRIFLRHVSSPKVVF